MPTSVETIITKRILWTKTPPNSMDKKPTYENYCNQDPSKTVAERESFMGSNIFNLCSLIRKPACMKRELHFIHICHI